MADGAPRQELEDLAQEAEFLIAETKRVERGVRVVKQLAARLADRIEHLQSKEDTRE
jgi:hypothetical protein